MFLETYCIVVWEVGVDPESDALPPVAQDERWRRAWRLAFARRDRGPPLIGVSTRAAGDLGATRIETARQLSALLGVRVTGVQLAEARRRALAVNGEHRVAAARVSPAGNE